MAGDAIGFIETRGFAALTRATDAMHKAAAVERLDLVPIGSAYVTILTYGDVAAVKAAVDAGLKELGKTERLVGSNVIPSPHPEILNRFRFGEYRGQGEYGSALGLIETKGLAGLITAHDAALKAAQTTTIGFFAVGSGLVSIVLRGDVAAVKAALQAADEAAGGAAETHARAVLPSPHPALTRSMIESRFEPADRASAAVGIVETRGYVGAFVAADAGLKVADVQIECWKKIGGGLVSVTFCGDVASVESAVDAGAESAQRTAELVARLVIPRPHETVYAEM